MVLLIINLFRLSPLGFQKWVNHVDVSKASNTNFLHLWGLVIISIILHARRYNILLPMQLYEIVTPIHI